MKYWIIFLFISISTNPAGWAQIDTIKYSEEKTEISTSAPIKKERPKWYKTRGVQAAIVPTILIGYGISTIQGHGIYSSYEAQRDIQKHLGGAHSKIDDYLIWAPYVELAALNLLKIKCQNDFINTSLLIIKSQIIMSALVFPIKKLTHIQRPDKSNYESFPSGHTAQAFVAASIVHKEYRHKSQWYGIGAYTIATTVGVFRMINNKHWQSDVFAGAGIGILSAHIAYLTHRYKWGRKGTCIVPTFQNGSKGLAIAWRF
jgi:membrane-associated phospholipid phosphatase